MQTFLPFGSFMQTAECLDMRRLGKQRVEAKQILQCLLEEGSTGWSNHPIVLAWWGHEEALAVYGLYICSEWNRRGYRDTLFPWFQTYRLALRDGGSHMTEFPAWTKMSEVHMAYQRLLVWKQPEIYEEIFDFVQLKEPEFPWELLRKEV